MPFPQHIFKAYDIRGLVAGELTGELAYGIGRAFVAFLRTQNVNFQGRRLVVGRDMRASGVLFATEVIRGINDEGVDVVDIGLASTPLFNFAVTHYTEHAGGIMVTASHNPSAYNGFKLALENGLAVGGSNGMVYIRDRVEVGQWTEAVSKRGDCRLQEVFADYQKTLFGLVPHQGMKPLKIVIDAGNGMGEVTFPRWLALLPVQVEYLYLNPDGNFPHHEANPVKTETLHDLQQKVLSTGADFGFALDGDCDRIGLVDEKGEVVPASAVGALIGLEVLKKHPGATMFYDLRSSQIVPEVWEKNGAKTEKCQVGHANIKPLMKAKKAAFASELSLHLYFHDLSDVESSDLCLLYVLKLLSQQSKPLGELVQPFKKYAHSGEINFEIENKMAALNRVREVLGEQAEQISDLDGLWMKFGWGWLSLRLSNTEPVLRLNLEVREAQWLGDKIQEVKKIIQGS